MKILISEVIEDVIVSKGQASQVFHCTDTRLTESSCEGCVYAWRSVWSKSQRSFLSLPDKLRRPSPASLSTGFSSKPFPTFAAAIKRHKMGNGSTSIRDAQACSPPVNRHRPPDHTIAQQHSPFYDPHPSGETPEVPV